MISRLVSASLLVMAMSPAAAQQVSLCDWQASAQAIAEPWEENTRTFANGRVRVAALDTTEPAVGFAWLLVLSPPYGPLGERQCRVIGASESVGFAGIYFDTLESGYDPQTGLSFTLQVRVYQPETDEFARRFLTANLNQSTGDITATLGADDL